MLNIATTVLFAGLALSAPGLDQGCGTSAAPARPESIVQTAVSAGNFKTLAAALKAADLIDTLTGSGPFTVFAPTDEAFAKLPPGAVETLLKPESKARLQSILSYHVVKGQVLAAQVAGMTFAPTLAGQRASISTKGGGVLIDGKAQVTKTDILCSNGVIHMVDTVLMPSDKDIIQTAVAAGSFTTLATALQAAGLVDALRGKGPFTVFAPTDEAFAKLPPGTVASLLKPENKEKLASILKFHVLSGAVYADQAAAMTTSSETLQGGTFSIRIKDGVWVGNDKAMGRVVSPDIQASNGVIHVIDTVLMPK